VNKLAALWVSIRGGRHGINKPKSGTMLPIMVADNSLQRASGRENGSTAAACEMVNGIKNLACHISVILQLYKP
jgi:hypothetical protein